MLLARLLKKIIVHGRLEMIDAHGRRHEFVGGDGPHVAVRLHDPALHWQLALYPSLRVGEAYVNGTLTLEKGTLREFLEILLHSQNALEDALLPRLQGRLKELYYRREIVNRIGRAERNVKHHYDLSPELYRLFLDSDQQYSCAYFREAEDELELAQLRKKQHLASKLLLEPGQRVLDIGSGWGGLALYLAGNFDVHVTGLTLSDEQYEVASQRARALGLDKRVTFKMLDYRQEEGSYDRIVSVGMFEHVGAPHYGEFFTHMKRLMGDDGICLLHTIGRMGPPSPTNVWIRRYIFPGGYLPSLSQLAPIFERQGIWLADFENLRLHYAETLRHWNDRFQKHRRRIAEIYDEAFCRMWEFYLQSCEMGFRLQGLTVFQLLLHKRIDAVPLTRDFMYETEARLIETDADALGRGRLAGE